ncbi:MAG TPA: hypothetical protein DC009_06445, partial [Porphyromonadaceae bacterium]|nr:hypothetical protein [Porphyromonadaceae bacterium]
MRRRDVHASCRRVCGDDRPGSAPLQDDSILTHRKQKTLNMNKVISLISAAFVLSATCLTMSAAIPDGYYSALEGKKQSALKAAAKSAAASHTRVSYGDDTWDAFRQTDVRTVNGQKVWWDMYSDNNVSVSGGHGGMNIEHSVPNSWWGKAKNDAYCDLFHLNPSDKEANNRKANYPLGIVATVKWTNGVTTVGSPASGACGGASWVFEPADEY